MDQTLLWHLSMGLIGISFELVGLRGFLSEGPGIGSSLMIIGGIGLIVQAGYFALRKHRTTKSKQGKTIWIAVVAAVLSVLGALLILL